MSRAGVSLTGSCHLLHTGGRSLPASERPFPSAARRAEEVGHPPGTLQKGKRLVRQGRGLGSRDKDGHRCSSGLYFYHRHQPSSSSLQFCGYSHFPKNDISSFNPQCSCGAGAVSPFCPCGMKTGTSESNPLKVTQLAKGFTVKLRLLVPPGPGWVRTPPRRCSEFPRPPLQTEQLPGTEPGTDERVNPACLIFH